MSARYSWEFIDYIGVVLFFLFFGAIATMIVTFVIQDERAEKLSKKCMERGGVIFEYKSAASTRSYICMDPKSIISLEE